MDGGVDGKLSAGQHLLASAESGQLSSAKDRSASPSGAL